MKGSLEINKVKDSLQKSARTDNNRIHIIARSNGWAVKKEGNVKASIVKSQKKEAIEYAKEIIKKGYASKLVIHKANGEVAT